MSAVYDSNVALADAPASTGRTESDQVFVINPFGQLEYFSPRTNFATTYRGSIRRYVDVSQLNGYDQRVIVNGRRLVTKRLTMFLTNTYAETPTTDEAELNGVPFSRTGTKTNIFGGGLAYRLSQFTDLSLRYQNNWVHFDRRPGATSSLADGTVNGGTLDLSRRLSERLTAGARYSVRFTDLNEGARRLTFQDVGATVGYVLGPHTTVSAAAGYSHLNDKSLDITRSGPFFRLSGVHSLERVQFGGHFERTYVPSFGLGGSNQSQELRGYVTMPVYQNRAYVQASATWRHTDPLVESELSLDTIWLRSTLGYSASRWLRLEAFHAYTRQDSAVTGGEIDRHRAGIQAVISQPMRIR